MNHVLLFGAGKSATVLIDYLVQGVISGHLQLTVCDADLELAQSKIGRGNDAKAVSVDVTNDLERSALISTADIVISLLPPALHFLVAKDCVTHSKHLLTASYIDDDIRSLEADIKSKGLLFLCEMGLDPGIDHMSALQLIHRIKNEGGNITAFKSHCGGLVAPESDNNPWHYKISWNPRNIVLAGKDGAVYRDHGIEKTEDYKVVFKDCTALHIEDGYSLCWYPNRNSLSYIDLYELHGIETFVRTTLRHPAFCRGWHKFVNLGLTRTDDIDLIKDCQTYADWFQLKIKPYASQGKEWNFYLHRYITDPHRHEFNKQLNFLGIESKNLLPEGFGSSADILQHILESKLKMQEHDKDMIVMLHEIEYTIADEKKSISSSLIVTGEDSRRTAMAKTVGLPLGIATKLMLMGKINLTGLHIPVLPEIYDEVMVDLEKNGVVFKETIRALPAT